MEQEEIEATNIFIDLSETNVLIDEDSGNEEINDTNHMWGNQLRAGAYVRCDDDIEEEFEYAPEFDRKTLSNICVWNCPLEKSQIQKYWDFSQLELFELFFDEEMIGIVARFYA